MAAQMTQTGNQVRDIVTSYPLTFSVSLDMPLTPSPEVCLALKVCSMASQIESAWESSRGWLKIRLYFRETAEGPENLHF